MQSRLNTVAYARRCTSEWHANELCKHNIFNALRMVTLDYYHLAQFVMSNNTNSIGIT